MQKWFKILAVPFLVLFLLAGTVMAVNIMGSTAPGPEPSTMLLLGTGLIGLTGVTRRKINKK